MSVNGCELGEGSSKEGCEACPDAVCSLQGHGSDIRIGEGVRLGDGDRCLKKSEWYDMDDLAVHDV